MSMDASVTAANAAPHASESRAASGALVGRLSNVDLIRMVAALMVLFYHYFLRGDFNQMNTVSFPAMSEVSPYFYLGLHVFFMLSGFVIAISAQRYSAFQFGVMRALRLYPVFWVSVLMTFLLIEWVGIPNHAPSFSDFLLNLTMIPDAFDVALVDPVYWTLFVEVKFYFYIFLFILIGWQQRLLWMVMGLTALNGLSLLGVVPDIAAQLMELAWMPLFCLGMLLYLHSMQAEGKGFGWVQLLFVINLLLAMWYASEDGNYLSGVVQDVAFAQNMSALILAVLIMLTAWIIIYAPQFPYLKWASLLGGMSYPLYLTHQMFGYAVFNSTSQWLSPYVALVGALMLSLLIAYIVHVVGDRWMGQPLKQRLVRS